MPVKIREKRPGYFEARPSINGKVVSITGTSKQSVKTELDKLLTTRKLFKTKAVDASLGSYLTSWLETQKQRVLDGEIAPQTYLIREQTLRTHVLPRLGHIELASCDRALIKRYYDGLRGGGSTRAVQSSYDSLRAAFNDAVELDYIAANPCASTHGSKRSKGRPFHQPKDVEFLRPAQVDALLAASRWTGFPEYGYYMTLLGFGSGLRLGELLSLAWHDLDLIDGWVTVTKTISRDLDRRYYVKPKPKSLTSKRRISIAGDVAAKLVEWREATGPSAFVFPSSDDTFIHPSNFRERFFYRATAKAELSPEFTFHGLRHTHASDMIADGMNFKDLQHRLGHSSIRITIDTYGHLVDDSQQAVRRILDRSNAGSRGLVPNSLDLSQGLSQNLMPSGAEECRLVPVG